MGLGARASADTAPSATPGVHLSWVRSESASMCPDANFLEADVSHRLGRSAFVGPSQFSIEVAVSKNAGTWKADIEMRDAKGHSLGSRKVTSEAATCASLASAASLAMALLIERYAPAPSTPPPAAPPSASVVPTESAMSPKVARPAPPPPKPASKRESAASGSFALLGAMASNVLPSTSFGVGIVADINLGQRWFVSIGGDFFPEERMTVSDIDVAFSMTWGSIGGCYRFLARGPVHVSGCAAGLLGAMHSVVLTQVPWQTGQHLWTAGTAGGRLTWAPAGPFEVRANLEALVPAHRRTYAVQGVPPEPDTVLFTEPGISAVASIGVGLRY
jgi:hypothetical protein